MVFGLSARSMVLCSMLCSVAAFAAVTPYPPYPGAKVSPSFEVTVDGQPVFVHRFLTYDQFQFMDYASFSMTGKVRVTVTNLVGEMNVLTCDIRPLAYAIKPQIGGNTCSFDLDRPRYLLVFPNEVASFGAAGLMLFAEPPEKNPPNSAIRMWSTSWTTRWTTPARQSRPRRSIGPSATSPPSLGAACSFSPRASTWQARCL